METLEQLTEMVDELVKRKFTVIMESMQGEWAVEARRLYPRILYGSRQKTLIAAIKEVYDAATETKMEEQ